MMKGFGKAEFVAIFAIVGGIILVAMSLHSSWKFANSGACLYIPPGYEFIQISYNTTLIARNLDTKRIERQWAQYEDCEDTSS
jgi:hypothetical protein